MPPTVSLTLWVFLCYDVAYYAAVGELTVLSNLVTVDEENMSVLSIYLIPWKRLTILFAMDVVHFGLSFPFIQLLYSWDLPVSGKRPCSFVLYRLLLILGFCLCAPSLLLSCVPCIWVMMLRVVWEA